MVSLVLGLSLLLLCGYSPGAAETGGALVEKMDHDLNDKCFNNIFLAEWWSYVWCHKVGVRQLHFNHQSQQIETEINLGVYKEEESSALHQIFRGDDKDCFNDKTGEMSKR